MLINMIGAALCLLVLNSCQSESEKKSIKLTRDLKEFFIQNYTDSSMSVDSFRLISIDTLSQFDLYYQQTNKLLSDQDILTSYIELARDKLKLSSSKISMYRILESKDLIDVETKNFKDIYEKSNIMLKEHDTLGNIIQSLIDSSKIADTIKPISYLAVCFYQIKNKDKSVERDTAYIYLNINKDIIKREDFLKIPYKVDFEKFQ